MVAFVVPLSGLATSACGILGAEDRLFSDHHVYVHQLFETEEQCEEWRQLGTEQNCVEIARFCPDGTADWLIGGGDIVYRGSYSITGRKLTLRSPHIALVRFRLSADERELIHEPFGTVWVRGDDDEPGFNADSCPAPSASRVLDLLAVGQPFAGVGASRAIAVRFS